MDSMIRSKKCSLQLLLPLTILLLFLHIKDNGCGISEEIIDKINHLDPSIDMDDKNTGCNGIGLMNIQKRLRLTYGNNYGISIQKNFKDGTHILICIPKKQSGDMSN